MLKGNTIYNGTCYNRCWGDPANKFDKRCAHRAVRRRYSSSKMLIDELELQAVEADEQFYEELDYEYELMYELELGDYSCNEEELVDELVGFRPT